MKTRPSAPFAVELKRLRLSRFNSQSKLARRMSINHCHVSRLEQGTRRPSREMVNRLIYALDLNPDERRRLITAAFLPADLVAVSGDPLDAMKADFV